MNQTNVNPFPNMNSNFGGTQASATPTFNNQGSQTTPPMFNHQGTQTVAPTFNNQAQQNNVVQFNNVPQQTTGLNNQAPQTVTPTVNNAPTFTDTPAFNNQVTPTNQPFNTNNSNNQTQEYEKDEKKLYHERSKIVKFATNTTFFEVLNYNFKRGTIVVKMQSYGNKKDTINISLKFQEFLYLKHLVMTGSIYQMEKDNYGNFKFKFQKGTGKNYGNGEVTARQLSFQTSRNPERYPLVFFAQEGPGKQDNKGLIQFAGKPTKSVMFPMTTEMLIEFFEVTTLHIQGYISASYQHRLVNNPFFTQE